MTYISIEQILNWLKCMKFTNSLLTFCKANKSHKTYNSQAVFNQIFWRFIQFYMNKFQMFIYMPYTYVYIYDGMCTYTTTTSVCINSVYWHRRASRAQHWKNLFIYITHIYMVTSVYIQMYIWCCIAFLGKFYAPTMRTCGVLCCRIKRSII